MGVADMSVIRLPSGELGFTYPRDEQQLDGSCGRTGDEVDGYVIVRRVKDEPSTYLAARRLPDGTLGKLERLCLSGKRRRR